MRTDCSVKQEEVVAIVLDDVASAITSSSGEVKACIEAGGIGWCKRIAKDFLRPTANTTRINRGPNCVKRKCCTIKLSVLPPRHDATTQKWQAHNCLISHCVLMSLVCTCKPQQRISSQWIHMWTAKVCCVLLSISVAISAYLHLCLVTVSQVQQLTDCDQPLTMTDPAQQQTDPESMYMFSYQLLHNHVLLKRVLLQQWRTLMMLYRHVWKKCREDIRVCYTR